MNLHFNTSEGLFDIEDDILLFIQNNFRSENLNDIVKFITHLGDKGLLWCFISIILILTEKHCKTGLKLAASQGIGSIITNLITKNAVHRSRPFDVIAGLETIIPPPSDWSFPSGHTTSSIAAGTLLFMCMPKKYGIPALVLGICISLSRMYVGVHYPTDIIAGALVGIFAAISANKLIDKISARVASIKK